LIHNSNYEKGDFADIGYRVLCGAFVHAFFVKRAPSRPVAICDYVLDCCLWLGGGLERRKEVEVDVDNFVNNCNCWWVA
jgi:hypothetical protein